MGDQQESRDVQELAALSAAIPALTTLLGGETVPGPWDFNEHQLRVQHRPGAGISASYRMPAGTGFAELGLSTEKIHVPGAVSIQVPGPIPTRIPGRAAGVDAWAAHGPPVTVTGWIHPNDPMLPGLATALDEREVTRLWGQGDVLGSIRTVAYRPLRRAVVRVSFATRGPVRIERSLFLKVGREHASAALLKRHRLMEHSPVPVPPVLEPVVPGILALEAGLGAGLASAIRADAEQRICPEDFIEMLDALPRELMELPARRAWSDGILRYSQAAVLALPGHRERIGALVQRIEYLLARSGRGPLVPVHGDFYDGNILMRGSRIGMVLDLDSLGPGHRVDDLACFLGHLAALPSIGATNRPAVAALERFGGVFECTVDPVALWSRAGAVALTLVAGARVAGSESWVPAAEARLRVAEELVDRAERQGPGRAG